MRMSATTYTNKKGQAMVLVRMTIDDAAAIAVARAETISELREVLSDKLNSERESVFGEERE